MKPFLKLLLIVIVFGLMSGDVLAAAGINRKINFAGKVVQKGVGGTDGVNVANGNYDFTFSLWTVLSGGTSIWSESWTGGSQVAVNSGIFQVALGTNSTFPTTVDFNTDSLYVSVNFNGDGDMTPRIQMAAVPYAFNAEKVSGLTIIGTGVSLNQNLTTGSTVSFAGVSIGVSSNPLYTLSAGGTANLTNLFVEGFVGIGKTNPSKNVDVVGTGYFTGNFWSDKVYALNAGTTALPSFSYNSDADTGLYFPVANNLGFVTNGAEVVRINGTGNVGIGTTNPTYKLSVVGDASISTNLSIGGSLNLSGVVLGTGTSMLFIDGTGNIVKGTLPDTGVGKSRVITLSPEYPGASLSADGSGTTAVAMTSDNTLNAGSVGWKNYYQLSSSEATLQDYSVLVRVTLPSDFGTWETGSCPGTTCALEFNYQTGVGTTGDNRVSYIVSNDVDTPGSAVCSIGNTAATAWNKSGCAEATLNDNSAPEWDAPGESAIIRIKMAAKNTSSALTRVGDIVLRYKSIY